MNEDSKGCTLDVCYSHVPLGEAEGINSNQGNPQKIGVEDKNENPQKIGVEEKIENKDLLDMFTDSAPIDVKEW